jgi:cytochrome bd-type quinol oxidase subunit 1
MSFRVRNRIKKQEWVMQGYLNEQTVRIKQENRKQLFKFLIFSAIILVGIFAFISYVFYVISELQLMW